MIDIAATCAPKSDQLNADDLIAGPRTITITAVKLAAEDQPVAIHFQGDDGKPWKPCKSMRRVLMRAWGADGAQYVGKSATLFLEPGVRFGGAEVGGIRISHLSHIDKSLTMALTVTRASKKAYTVKPLAMTTPASETHAEEPPAADPDLVKAGTAAASDGVEMYKAWLGNLTPEQKATIKQYHGKWSKVARLVDESTEMEAA